MTCDFIDRRASHRSGIGGHGIISARVRPGHFVTVIDVSAGGASIDLSRRLLPGSAVDLQISTARRGITLRGRVLRCTVIGLHSASVSYRAAMAFDCQWPGFLEGDSSEYQIPAGEPRPTPAERVESTRDGL